MPRILSVSSSRADVGILRPIWRALAAKRGCEVHVVTTGMHRAEHAAEVVLPAGVVGHSGGADLGGRSGAEAASGMIACAEAAAELLARIEFDCVMLMGDRLDMLPAGYAALPFNVPIAHLHGGELSYGAIDDRVRHAISKLSHLHFVSNVDSANRLVRMGEEPWRIHVTGAPGLDTLREAPAMDRDRFVRTLGLPDDGPFIVMTVHAETNTVDPAAPMAAALQAVNSVGVPALITAPNSDPGGMQLREMIGAFLLRHPTTVFRETLGPELYPNALRHAAAMIGNSSSGLIEAGLFGLPAINIGDRQAGRLSGANVRHVRNDTTAVAAELRAILSQRMRYRSHTPYGDGASAQRIASVLGDLPEKKYLLYKVFNETGPRQAFVAPWEGTEADGIGKHAVQHR
jgi:UDP-hydrolysing UDP-N-acetyl-D-glucosamine 2-epimerase